MPYRSHQVHHSPAEAEAAEKEILKKLGAVVDDAFSSVAKMTKLSVPEVMHIIEEVDVDLLRRATQEAIKRIAHATDLDSAHITAVFTANSSASLDDIVKRLHDESKIGRSRV